jgi:hypothetical protein
MVSVRRAYVWGCFSLASSWRRKIEKGERPRGTSTTKRPPRQQLHLLFSLTAFLAARYLMLLPSFFSLGERPCVATGTYNITITYVLYVSVATHGHSPSDTINWSRMSFSNRCPTCTPLDGVGSLAYMARILFWQSGTQPPAWRCGCSDLFGKKIALAKLRTGDLTLHR